MFNYLPLIKDVLLEECDDLDDTLWVIFDFWIGCFSKISLEDSCLKYSVL